MFLFNCSYFAITIYQSQFIVSRFLGIKSKVDITANVHNSDNNIILETGVKELIPKNQSEKINV